MNFRAFPFDKQQLLIQVRLLGRPSRSLCLLNGVCYVYRQSRFCLFGPLLGPISMLIFVFVAIALQLKYTHDGQDLNTTSVLLPSSAGVLSLRPSSGGVSRRVRWQLRGPFDSVAGTPWDDATHVSPDWLVFEPPG